MNRAARHAVLAVISAQLAIVGAVIGSDLGVVFALSGTLSSTIGMLRTARTQ